MPTLIELKAGQRFNHWTVLRRANRGECVNSSYYCRCDCGHEQNVPSQNLRDGRSKRCLKCCIAQRIGSGQSQQGKAKVGDKHGKWTIIGPEFVKVSDKNYEILCRCDCGFERMLRVANARRDVHCDACISKVRSISGIRAYWRHVLWSAKRRNKKVNVTEEFALSLLEKQGGLCALSGVAIKMGETWSSFRAGECTASLDRIESDRDYDTDNIQWVHKDLNWLKCDTPNQKFIDLCCAVADYQRSRARVKHARKKRLDEK